ncbi:hypothetical protein QNH48_14420 [Neobacillus sp. YX16]|uniref:hypothetical protein n=1 Tax=Neobacillus sp. YX16 TaxID=3047874 RepID=UPI0024C26E9A|nr:hypothetical protein [Neobacillus sp. YX16]WHZ05741.1 hypothetical protein QNH48_14420 [Neobacillus sp. YX16]
MGIRICPPVTDYPNEPHECRQRRIDFALDSPIALNNGMRISFPNIIGEFPQLATCDNLTGDPEFSTPTVEELANPFVQAELSNRDICPMVVWALNNGVPTLVRLESGSVQPVIILPTLSESCPAYIFCLANP